MKFKSEILAPLKTLGLVFFKDDSSKTGLCNDIASRLFESSN